MNEKEEMMKKVEDKMNEFQALTMELGILAQEAIKLDGLDEEQTKLLMGILQAFQNPA